MFKRLIISFIISVQLIGLNYSNSIAEGFTYSKSNHNNNYMVQSLLNRLPYKLLNDINNSNVSIVLDDNFLNEHNKKYDGQYTYSTKVITLDSSNKSIEHSLYHEIGHYLEDKYQLHNNDKILKSFLDEEFYFGSNYYNESIKEYIAESINHYLKSDLYKDSDLYKELDSVLKNL